MKTRILLLACVVAILSNGCASTSPPKDVASTPVQKTTFSGTVQPVWYFYAVNVDCTSAGLPTVEVTKPASHGSVVIQNVEHFTEYPSTNQRYECNKRRSQSVAVVYTSEKAFVGFDRFTVKSIFPSGDTTTKAFVVSVEKPPSVSHKVEAANVGTDEVIQANVWFENYEKQAPTQNSPLVEQQNQIWRDKPQYAALAGARHLKEVRMTYAAVAICPGGLGPGEVDAKVNVSFVVGLDGRVEDARVIWSSDERFNAAALDAMRQDAFIPAVGPTGAERAMYVKPFHFTTAGSLQSR